jgi:hypothetical protein
LSYERAAGALGRFDGVKEDLTVIDDIGRQLDDLPLAIGLTAARLGTMTLPELRQRLGDRFRLLTRRRVPSTWRVGGRCRRRGRRRSHQGNLGGCTESTRAALATA